MSDSAAATKEPYYTKIPDAAVPVHPRVVKVPPRPQAPKYKQTLNINYKDVRSMWVNFLVREKLSADVERLRLRYRNTTPPIIPLPEETLASASLPPNPTLEYPSGEQPPNDTRVDREVCIFGAGIAGFYMAMIFGGLKVPGLGCEILEASPRICGRLYTHRFGNDRRWDNYYYDVTAYNFHTIKYIKY